MLRAREVLADCKFVWELLEKEENCQVHRILWVAGMALVRAVGHVLRNVDSKRSTQAQNAINSAHARWKKKDNARDEIFVHFIENERNIVLKEYDFGYDDAEYTIDTGGTHYEIPGLLYCPLKAGPYAGEDCRDLLRDAIEWWEVELNKIDQVLQVQPFIR